MDLTLSGFDLQVIRQGGFFVAYSHSLDIATTGKSEKQALAAFSTLAQLFIKEVIRSETEHPGSFHQSLLDLGWTKRAKRWFPPALKAHA